ncbi:MAG: hypothetical protein H3C38_11505 [Rhodospirillales bacterium]|nr:hypothetical protein [Rhodospirillales bacterium]
MFRNFLDWVHPPPLRALSAVEDATERSASRLTHKATVGYCRIKAAGNAKKLFEEEAFAPAIELCRWEAFAGLLADHLRVLEGRLRAAAGERAEEMGDCLVAYYERVLTGYAHPAGGGVEAWRPHIATVKAQIARARLAPPIPAYELSVSTGNRIYDSLPLHKNFRREDREVITNLVRFGLVAYQEDLSKRLDAAPVVAQLLGNAARE